MKRDLDLLMQKYAIDVLLITGAAQHNPAMVYLTGGGHITGADLIKKRGDEPVLFCGAMEREEAIRTGLKTITYSKYPLADRLKEAAGDADRAAALRYKKMFEELGIEAGNVAIYGEGDVGAFYTLISLVQKEMPQLRFKGFPQDELMQTAMMTKDEEEIARVRNMGKVTVEVVGKTADYLTGHKAVDGVLVHSDHSPVTIGEIKGLINLWLAERNAENPEGTIFAQGHDAGVPHSTGTNSAPIKLGEPIVYDIFPCEAGGGYFYDFTRTWCLGYATDEVQKLYNDVHTVYQAIAGELTVNTPYSHYQFRTCEMFEKMGHPTVMSAPATENGYVHSLGHGVGLRIHEKPGASISMSPKTDVLAPGVVFAMEPGLYYPEKGMGVRI
ncbi:aminopeptidase P family protein, partial [bacterium]|nr:aminopeptidase P family protein [bacterium]